MTDEQQRMIFSSNLKRYIELRDLTQREVADAIGVSYQRISSWVQGKAMPRFNKLVELANYFGIDRSDLLESNYDGYFYNKETAKIAQAVYESPELKLVFDACRNTTPDELKQIARLAKAIKGNK